MLLHNVPLTFIITAAQCLIARPIEQLTSLFTAGVFRALFVYLISWRMHSVGCLEPTQITLLVARKPY